MSYWWFFLFHQEFSTKLKVFRKKIFNFQKFLIPKQKISFSVNDLITILGTSDNIVMVKATLTRLRVTVKDLDEVDFELLKTKFKLKHIDTVLQTVIMPFGNISVAVKSEIDAVMQKEQ
ncbi:PTS transporter subunit EIIB [Spiroplasma endosymbiont of Sarcophaga carnaria]|uniref:PTS transporter subunit EIIB n=1 Tax=Spiroplasma endosymbiont of Sarcophaga carnaria TaxID=3066303 RepID=UPI0030CDA008